MVKLNILSTYPPIVCGIASYTKYLTDFLPKNIWNVLSFNLNGREILLDEKTILEQNGHVLYKIPSYTDFNFPTVLKNLLKLNDKNDDPVLFIQHSFGLWRDNQKFIMLLKKLIKKYHVVVSCHTIHFQGRDTKYGLTNYEYRLLKEMLPIIDALTVFSNGVYNAVVKSFPKYKYKIVVLRHGIPSYPPTNIHNCRQKLFDHLISSFKKNSMKRQELEKVRDVFFDEKTKIIGDIGFISEAKNFEAIYLLRDMLQKKLPDYNIISMVIGSLRTGTSDEKNYLRSLKEMHDGKKNFFIEHYLPDEYFALGFKSFDVNVSWNKNCTQSGRLSHAQGIGTVIISRDVEGVGETLKLSNCPVANNYEELVSKLLPIISSQNEMKKVQKNSRKYAKKYSWKNQSEKHIKLAKALLSGKELPVLDNSIS